MAQAVTSISLKVEMCPLSSSLVHSGLLSATRVPGLLLCVLEWTEQELPQGAAWAIPAGGESPGAPDDVLVGLQARDWRAAPFAAWAGIL